MKLSLLTLQYQFPHPMSFHTVPHSAAGLNRPLSNQRIETLVDGVFAIVLTLLVLDIKAPNSGSEVELFHQLLKLGPQLFSYIFSFIVLSIFWFGHQMESHYIHHSDRIHLWLNLLFLMCIAFLPFSASVLGAHWLNQVAIITYCLNLFAAGSVRYIHWQYAALNHRLIRADLSETIIRSTRTAFLWTPILCLITIAVSFLSVKLSLIGLTFMPINFALRISHIFHRQH